MAYKLEQPYTEEQRIEFIVDYNHKMGLNIEETDNAMYALLADEIMVDNLPVKDESYEQKLQDKRKDKFEKEFFLTSLGWIRRKVRMKDGSLKSFLSDLLIPIKTGMEAGSMVEIITYKMPDFSKEITNDYMVTLQERKNATTDFVQECLNQIVADFCGV